MVSYDTVWGSKVPEANALINEYFSVDVMGGKTEF